MPQPQKSLAPAACRAVGGALLVDDTAPERWPEFEVSASTAACAVEGEREKTRADPEVAVEALLERGGAASRRAAALVVRELAQESRRP